LREAPKSRIIKVKIFVGKGKFAGMKKALLLVCILVFAVALAHELVLDASAMQHVDFSDIPVLSEKDAVRMQFRLPWMADSLTLSVGEQLLPEDDSRRFYAPVSDGITVRLPARAKVARTPFETDAAGNTTCKIIRYDGISRSVRQLLVTGLPVLDLSLIDRESENIPIGDEGRQLGLVRLFFTDAAGTLTVQTEAVTARVRGASSRQYKKKSYTLAFVEEDGSARKASLLDFPADTEYGLNSLYEDDAKIRDILALEVWASLDAHSRKAGEKANTISMHYTELLIDGQYWGLYGLQQLITPDALALEEGDALYKINGKFADSKTYYLRVSGGEVVKDVPQGNAEEMLQQAFSAFKHYDTADVPTVAPESALDYALLLQLACCVDSETRNMALCYRAEENAFRMIGWDLDQSFGAYWDGSPPTGISYDPNLATTDRLAIHKWKDKPFSSLFGNDESLHAALSARYRELRETVFTDEFLLGQATVLYDTLTDCGARARDAARWPGSAISEDNNFMETFIPARMAFLDREFAPAN